MSMLVRAHGSSLLNDPRLPSRHPLAGGGAGAAVRPWDGWGTWEGAERLLLVSAWLKVPDIPVKPTITEIDPRFKSGPETRNPGLSAYLATAKVHRLTPARAVFSNDGRP